MLRVLAMLGVLGMTTLVLADPPAASMENDLDRLQGTWMPLQCEVEGKAQQDQHGQHAGGADEGLKSLLPGVLRRGRTDGGGRGDGFTLHGGSPCPSPAP